MSQSLSEDPSTHPCPRPASPFFRHRPLGRAPSPPTWACYEQIPARSDLLGSSDSDSDSGDAADDDSLSDADSSSSSASSSSASASDADAAGLMDVESDKNETTEDLTRSAPSEEAGDPEKQRDKGKQRAEDPSPNTAAPKPAHVPHSRSRRTRGRHPPMSVLRPILTIQRSQGFVWNQVRCLVFAHPSLYIYLYILTTNRILGSFRSTIYKGSLCCFHFSAHLFWRIFRLRVHVHFSGRLRNRGRRDPRP